MLVVIPTFGARISPRFDCAPSLVFVDLANGAVRERWDESIRELHWRTRITLLVERHVDVLLCGGIRRCDFSFLANAGIDIRAGLAGTVDDVLEAFMRGQISQMKIGGLSIASGARRRRGPGRVRRQ